MEGLLRAAGAACEETAAQRREQTGAPRQPDLVPSLPLAHVFASHHVYTLRYAGVLRPGPDPDAGAAPAACESYASSTSAALTVAAPDFPTSTPAA